jgi:hypothetical protein
LRARMRLRHPGAPRLSPAPSPRGTSTSRRQPGHC